MCCVVGKVGAIEEQWKGRHGLRSRLGLGKRSDKCVLGVWGECVEAWGGVVCGVGVWVWTDGGSDGMMLCVTCYNCK